MKNLNQYLEGITKAYKEVSTELIIRETNIDIKKTIVEEIFTKLPNIFDELDYYINLQHKFIVFEFFIENNKIFIIYIDYKAITFRVFGQYPNGYFEYYNPNCKTLQDIIKSLIPNTLRHYDNLECYNWKSNNRIRKL